MDLVRGQQEYLVPPSDLSTAAALSTRYTMAPKFQPQQQQPSRVAKAAQMGHFDPDELTRRLYIVLADQQEHTERKRRTRLNRDGTQQQQHQHQSQQSQQRQSEGIQRKEGCPEKGPVATSTAATAVTAVLVPGGGGGSVSEQRRVRSSRYKVEKPSVEGIPASQTEYCRIPREAAKQFANTTTVEVMRSQPTPTAPEQSNFRSHPRNKDMENGCGNTDAGETAHRKLHQTQCQDLRERMLHLQQAQREREYWHSDAVIAAATRNRHTFGAELSRLAPDGNTRRNSTGNATVAALAENNRQSMLVTMDHLGGLSEETTPTEEPVLRDPADLRVDWTQRDESKTRPKLLLTPFLRKADSLWGLRGKLSSRDKTEVVDKGPQRQMSLKSPKSGFLAKFVSKR